MIKPGTDIKETAMNGDCEADAAPCEADAAPCELLQKLPCETVWLNVFAFLEPQAALNLGMCCKKNYANLFSFHPDFRARHYGTAYLIARCLYDMFYLARTSPPGMIGWYFAREWHCRHGFPLSRGTCFFIIRMPRAKHMFVINDVHRIMPAAFEPFERPEVPPYMQESHKAPFSAEAGQQASRRRSSSADRPQRVEFAKEPAASSSSKGNSDCNSERFALEWFRHNIMNHWPYVEIRAHCMYRSRKYNDAIMELQTRMASLLSTYFQRS